jgi:2-polyprenyl-3-methyl-5-hydroxy-6-metoxy-1,4-benzoquinol methylase
MEDLKRLFTETYTNNKWGSGESRSGPGSNLAYTEWIRKLIVELIEESGVHTIWDCSCGDWNWMKEISDRLPNYIGNDIVEDIVKVNTEKFGSDRIRFQSGDMLSSLKRIGDSSIDLVLCRHTLEHLPTDYSIDVVREIRRVSKWALITSNTHSGNSPINPDGHNARAINLEKDEYHTILGEPLSKHWDSIGKMGDSSPNLNLYKFNI